MKMNLQDVKNQEMKIIGTFPNTYTFTKNLAEKNLIKKMGNQKCLIFRPAIIASADKQPFYGWTDSMSAAGGLTIMGGIGAIQYVNGSGKNPLDLIPVDIVCDSILVTTAHSALTNNQLNIYNCSTSVQNPVSIMRYKEVCENVYRYV